MKQHAPSKGFVETIIVTEKQYANKEVIVGEEERTKQEISIERTIEL